MIMLNAYLLIFIICLARIGHSIAFIQSYNVISDDFSFRLARLRTSTLLLAKKKRSGDNSFFDNAEDNSAPMIKDVNQEIEDPSADSSSSNEALLKLKVEASSPFRLLRQYLFFAMAGGGSLGTIVGIPQLIKVLANNNFDDTKTALFNLGVNIGGVVAGVLLFLRERKQEEEKLEKYRKIERRANNKLTPAEIERRERLINLLPVEILLGVNKTIINPAALLNNPTTTNTSTLLTLQALAEKGPRVNTTEITRVVSISDLQEKGQQSVVIVTGDYNYIKDCLVDLRLRDQEEFSRENILVVPFCSNLSDQNKLEQDYEEVEKSKSVVKKGFNTNITPTKTTGETNAATLKRALEMLSAAYIGRPKQVSKGISLTF